MQAYLGAAANIFISRFDEPEVKLRKIYERVTVYGVSALGLT